MSVVAVPAPGAALRSPLHLLVAAAPGVGLSILIAAVAQPAGARLHVSPALLALLAGLALSFLHSEPRLRPGLGFSAREVLRLGVVLMGAKVTVSEIAALGVHALFITVGGLVLTLLIGFALGRMLGLSRGQSIIAAGSVGICGASAALAISAALPKTSGRERETAMAVALVTLAGTVAMVCYPLVARWLSLSAGDTAIFLGASLHEMAQAAGAGYAVSPEVGAQTVTVKLLRIACLAPTVIALRFVSARSDASTPGKRAPLLPWFVVGFVALAAASSFGSLSTPFRAASGAVSQWCVLASIAALAMRISPAEVLKAGPRLAVAVVLASLVLALAVVVALKFFG